MSTKVRPDEGERERAGGRVVVVLVLVLALLAGGGYAAAYAGAGDNVPRGTTVAGIDIGGRSAGAAVARLVAELGPRASEPIELLVDGESVSLDPSTSGLGVDFQATVRQAGGGRSWDPARLWDYYTGGDDWEPRSPISTSRSGPAPATDGSVSSAVWSRSVTRASGRGSTSRPPRPPSATPTSVTRPSSSP